MSGAGLNLLRMFLNLLPVRCNSFESEPAEFRIDETYSVHVSLNNCSPISFFCLKFYFIIQGTGTVVSGTCLRGTIRLNDNLLLGPDAVGNFTQVTIRSVHRKRMPVREVRGGQTASFALKRVSLDLNLI